MIPNILKMKNLHSTHEHVLNWHLRANNRHCQFEFAVNYWSLILFDFRNRNVNFVDKHAKHNISMKKQIDVSYTNTIAFIDLHFPGPFTLAISSEMGQINALNQIMPLMWNLQCNPEI